MHPSSIPFARAEALAMELRSHSERVMAFKWLGKLKELQGLAQNEPGVWTDIISHITNMLLECLDRNYLLEIFAMMPPEGVPDISEWKKYQPGKMAALIRNRQSAKQGDGGEQPISTHIAPNIRQYLAYQEVPKFGIQFYYAFSKDPITEWENADLAYTGDGIPFVESEESRDTSLLERSRYIEADEKAKKARKAEPKVLKVDEGDSPETIKFKKLPPHLRQRQLQREAEEAAVKNLDLTPVVFKAKSKPPYTHSYKPEMFGLDKEEQFESADFFFEGVEWDPEGRQERPLPEDAWQKPAHPFLDVPGPDLQKYEDYERFEREMEERRMLLDPRPRWLSPRKRAHFERIQTIQTQEPPVVDLSAISVEIDPEEAKFTRIEWAFDDTEETPSRFDSPVKAVATESPDSSSIDDILSDSEMNTEDMFADDQVEVPVAPRFELERPRFEPKTPQHPDVQKILASIRKSHGLSDEMVESIETELLNNSVTQEAAPEEIFHQSLQDLLPKTPPSVHRLIQASQRRTEDRRMKVQDPTSSTPLQALRPEDKRRMVQERLAALRQTKPKLVEGILVDISPEKLARDGKAVRAEEYVVSPRKYIQTIHARMVEEGDEDLEDIEAPSFEDYPDSDEVSFGSSEEDLDKWKPSFASTTSSSSDEFEDLNVNLPEPTPTIEDYNIAPIITAEQMAAEAQRYQQIKKKFVRQKFEPMKMNLDYKLLEEHIEEAVEMLQQDLLDPEISEMFTDALTILDRSIEELVSDEPMLAPPPDSPDAEQVIEDFENRLNQIYKVRELKYVPDLLDKEMDTLDFEEGAAGFEEELRKWQKTPTITLSAPSPPPKTKRGQRPTFAKKLFEDEPSITIGRSETSRTVVQQPNRVQTTTETFVTDEQSPVVQQYVAKDDGLTPDMRLRKLLDQIQDEGLLSADAFLEAEQIQLYQDELEEVAEDLEGPVRIEVTKTEHRVYQQHPEDEDYFDWMGPIASPPKPRSSMPTPAAPKKPPQIPGPSVQPSRTKQQDRAMKTPKPSTSRMAALSAPKIRGTAPPKKSARLESLAAPKSRGGATAQKPVKLTRSKSSLNRSGRG